MGADTSSEEEATGEMRTRELGRSTDGEFGGAPTACSHSAVAAVINRRAINRLIDSERPRDAARYRSPGLTPTGKRRVSISSSDVTSIRRVRRTSYVVRRRTNSYY